MSPIKILFKKSIATLLLFILTCLIGLDKPAEAKVDNDSNYTDSNRQYVDYSQGMRKESYYRTNNSRINTIYGAKYSTDQGIYACKGKVTEYTKWQKPEDFADGEIIKITKFENNDDRKVLSNNRNLNNLFIDYSSKNTRVITHINPKKNTTYNLITSQPYLNGFCREYALETIEKDLSTGKMQRSLMINPLDESRLWAEYHNNKNSLPYGLRNTNQRPHPHQDLPSTDSTRMMTKQRDISNF